MRVKLPNLWVMPRARLLGRDRAEATLRVDGLLCDL